MPQPLHTAPQNQLGSLTGMRFVAAFVVFLVHASLEMLFNNDELNATLVRTSLCLGYTCVEFFFVLSGFVMTWVAKPGDTPRRFWRRRGVRIYPNYLVAWVLALVLAFTLAGPVSLRQFLPSLFVVHAWSPDITTVESLNEPSWSLCVEFFFYLLFPWLFRLVLKIKDNRLWAAAGVTMAMVIAVPVLAGTLMSDAGGSWLMQMSPAQYWTIYLFPLLRLPDFLLGMITARIIMTGQRIPMGIPAALGLVGLVTLVQVSLPIDVWTPTALGAAPVALLIAALARADLTGTASPVRSRRMVGLGQLTYAFYMLHALVLQYAHVLIGEERQFGAPAALLIIVALFAVSLLLAWALYTYVETPCVRRWSRPRRPATPNRVDVPGVEGSAQA